MSLKVYGTTEINGLKWNEYEKIHIIFLLVYPDMSERLFSGRHDAATDASRVGEINVQGLKDTSMLHTHSRWS